MSHFQFECAIDDCLESFHGPITNGPAPRWHRKAIEKKSTASVPLSPYNINVSLSKTPVRTPIGRGKTPLKTPKKTPQKTPAKATPLMDRFIPNRATMDNNKNYYKLVNEPELEIKEESISPEARERVQYQKIMKDNLENASESRILRFKQRAPVAREGYQNNLRVIYSQNKGSATKAKYNRYIPRQAEKILDAPGLLNDFYLNLLDWGSTNCLAISLGQAVYIWDSATSLTKQLFQMESGNYVSSVSWVNGDTILAVGRSDGCVQLWDVEMGKCLRTMTGHSGRVGSLSWNSHILSSGCRSGMIHNHDVRVVNHVVSALSDHTQDVCGLSWSLDGKLLASGGNDNLVNIWSPLTSGQNLVHSFTQHMAAVKAVSWCPWQPNVLASGGGTADRHIRFWNVTSGTCFHSVDTKSQISSILWSKEHKELITAHGYSQNQLSIWKYPAMARIADLTGHRSRVLYVTMSPCGEYVASAGADETLRIWKCFEQDHSRKKCFVGLAGKSSTSDFSMINKIR